MLPGEQAYRAWRVFNDGICLSESGVEGVTIWFRRRLEDESSDSRIQLYRDGMWITNSAPNLLASDFGHNPPFDAVVLLDDGELYKLVRAAEGPEHLGLDRERLVTPGDTSRWKRLRELLAAVNKRLRDEVGEREDSSTFTPLTSLRSPDRRCVQRMSYHSIARAKVPVRRKRPPHRNPIRMVLNESATLIPSRNLHDRSPLQSPVQRCRSRAAACR